MIISISAQAAVSIAAKIISLLTSLRVQKLRQKSELTGRGDAHSLHRNANAAR